METIRLAIDAAEVVLLACIIILLIKGRKGNKD